MRRLKPSIEPSIRVPCQNGLVDIEHPEAQKRWDADRDETEAERLDRNWSSLLQELRVTQTGVQLLTGFLLTLPFQQRFTVLDGTMRTIYLVTVACSIGATVLLVAPVGMHRVLFRRHRLDAIVSASHACAIAGTGPARAGPRRRRRRHLRHGCRGATGAGSRAAARWRRSLSSGSSIPLPLRRKSRQLLLGFVKP